MSLKSILDGGSEGLALPIYGLFFPCKDIYIGFDYLAGGANIVEQWKIVY